MKKHTPLIRLPMTLVSLHDAQFVITNFFRDRTQSKTALYFISQSSLETGPNLLTNLFQLKKTPAINTQMRQSFNAELEKLFPAAHSTLLADTTSLRLTWFSKEDCLECAIC